MADENKTTDTNTEKDEEKKGKKDDLSKAVTELKISGGKKSSEQGMIIEANGTAYECIGRIGKGSFGVVYKAVEVGTNSVVAIKRVLQDPRYKNRELQIMKMVDHPNTVKLLGSFYERSKGEVFLNLVLGYVPKNLYEVGTGYNKRNERMPMILIQIYMYQLLRSLAYVHSLGICHRDIKPQNLLINLDTNELKLCDFGSAKILVAGEPNVSYICSRYYRAPELIFGSSDYTTSIDIWSSGCVMAELILGQPIFAGESGIDQLVEIIKVLGTPTREEIDCMNKDYRDYKQFPSIKPHPLYKLFPPGTPKTALDLMSKMLVYNPPDRIKPLQACAHSFFDDLRKPPQTATAVKMPKLVDFTPEELSYANKHGLLELLLPPGEFDQISKTINATPATQPEKKDTREKEHTDDEETDEENDEPEEEAEDDSSSE